MGMYTNAIKTVVSIKSPTGQGSSHLPVNSKGSNHQQANSKGSNHQQARATGQCNSRTKTGARALRTITGHSSNEAAVRADPAVTVDPVVAAEAAADEGKQLQSHKLIQIIIYDHEKKYFSTRNNFLYCDFM